MSLGPVPATAFAADPPDPFVLPGGTLAALTADIDDDGEREVVRLTGAAGSMVLEAWDIDDGTWAPTFSEEISELAGPGVLANEGAMPLAMLRTRVNGMDRVLAISSGYDPESGMPGCCLTVHELIEQAGRMGLGQMDAPQPLAESVAAVDLDGDGTDELIVWSVAWGEDGNASATMIEVLRRDDGAWRSMASWEEEGTWWVTSLVESDGVPGSEVIASSETDGISRVAWFDGAIAIDRTRLTLAGESAWVAGSVEGNLIVSSSRSLGLVRWPRGGEATAVATHESPGYPSVGVIGRGPNALLLVQSHLDSGMVLPTTRILDMRLEVVGEVSSTPAAVALSEMTDRVARSSGWGSPRNIWPYFGPADGAWGAEATSFISGGMLISATPGGSFDALPTGPLVGLPVGSAGPEGAWVALADSYVQGWGIAYLQGGFAFPDSRLVLVPLATLQDSTEREPIMGVTIEAGVETGRENGAVTVLAAPSGTEIVVSVVPGTIAVSWDGERSEDHGPIDGELRLAVPPPRRPQPDRTYSFERDLLLIGPDGSASVYRWEGTFAPEAPALTAWSQADALSLEATVAGRASPLSVVTVDGDAVALNEFGAYRATVDAPPWPRTVVVVARDPFGGEQRATVDVIGLVDYRGLPWVPIAGAATLVGGAVLFLRTPRHRPVAERATLDDGRLEDLDGDLI
jgi:hypothetical protein